MTRIRTMALLGGFCISASLSHAETVHMDMTVTGQAVKLPNGAYEVPAGGTAIFKARQPKMPTRNQEIWLFKLSKMSWIVGLGVFETNQFSYNLVNNLGRGGTTSVGSLLTYQYVHKIEQFLSSDYGQSDTVGVILK